MASKIYWIIAFLLGAMVIYFLDIYHPKPNISAPAISDTYHMLEHLQVLDPPDSIVQRIERHMIRVDSGTFIMGSPETAHQYIDDGSEKPAHTVTIGSYYIAQYPVTVREFGLFIQETGYQTSAEKFGFSALRGDDNQFKIYGLDWSYSPVGKMLGPDEMEQPVVFVSWYDAIAFCRWLNTKTKRKYRLPTEAEWDYGARGAGKSKGYKYAGSDHFDEVGWSGDNSGGVIHPVGRKKPNEIGLYDMSGLIYQWVSDWALGPYYAISPARDPKGPANGGQRIVRGGGWNRPNAMFQRIPLRHARFPASSTSNGGFRIAADL